MHNFKEFNVWQRAIDLVVKIYKITETFPESEKFGLISQIRRCGVSMVSNIAEGAGRKTDKDFSKFLSISLGSQFELETQLIVAYKTEIITEGIGQKVIDELIEIQKMTRTLIDKFS